jgi:hypothetical protein
MRRSLVLRFTSGGEAMCVLRRGVLGSDILTLLFGEDIEKLALFLRFSSGE